MDVATIVYVLWILPLSGDVMLEVGRYNTKEDCKAYGRLYSADVAEQLEVPAKRIVYSCWPVNKLWE